MCPPLLSHTYTSGLPNQIFTDNQIARESRKGYDIRRKAMTNLDSLLKHRDLSSLTEAHIVKAMVVLLSCMDVRVGP